MGWIIVESGLCTLTAGFGGGFSIAVLFFDIDGFLCGLFGLFDAERLLDSCHSAGKFAQFAVDRMQCPGNVLDLRIDVGQVFAGQLY